MVFQSYLGRRCGQTNAGARETVQMNKMFSQHSGKAAASFKSQWIRPSQNLCSPLAGRASREECFCLFSESLMFSVCCNAAMNLCLVSLLVQLCCKIGKWESSVGPVTLNCSGHLDLWILPSLPGALQDLRFTHAHSDQQNISCSLKQFLVMTYSVTGNHCKTLHSRD